MSNNPGVGFVMWMVAATAAFATARLIRAARPSRWIAEAFASGVTAILFGIAATALDFGGWKEPDWRAGLFAFLGAAIGIATVRLTSRA